MERGLETPKKKVGKMKTVLPNAMKKNWLKNRGAPRKMYKRTNDKNERKRRLGW